MTAGPNGSSARPRNPVWQAVLAGFLGWGMLVAPASAQTPDQDRIEEANRAIIRQALDAWIQGGGADRFFDVLAPDGRWIVAGSGPSARTYEGRQAVIDGVVRPLDARLSAPLVPTVRRIWSDEDHVLVRWDAEATTRDGKSYRNRHSWGLKMRDGKVIEATAFLDLSALDTALGRER